MPESPAHDDDGDRDHHEHERQREKQARDRIGDVAHREGSSPRDDHIAVTRSLVRGSISMSFGHSRVNPSSGHLRVASMPIFDPYVNARLEWSSTSIGPIVKRVSRSGSMLFSAIHHASCGSRTLTCLSTTMMSLASDMSPWPQSAFITLYACPGYCLSIETNTRLWKIPTAGMW